MKAPYCRLCETEHYSTQPHGGALAPKALQTTGRALLAYRRKAVNPKIDIKKIEAKARSAGKKKVRKK